MVLNPPLVVFGIGVLLGQPLHLVLILEAFDSLAEWVVVDVHLLDHDLLLGLVGLAGQVLVYLVEDYVGRLGDHLPEDGVLVVQVRGLFEGYEKLAAVGLRACVGHAQDARLRVRELGVELIFEHLAEDALASGASSRWISALHAEILDQSVEGESVVVAIFRQLYEIFAGFGHQVGVDEEIEVAEIGDHQHFALQLLLPDYRVYLLADFHFLEIPEGGCAFGMRCPVGAGETSRVDVISLSLVLVDLVLDAPRNKTLHVFS